MQTKSRWLSCLLGTDRWTCRLQGFRIIPTAINKMSSFSAWLFIPSRFIFRKIRKDHPSLFHFLNRSQVKLTFCRAYIRLMQTPDSTGVLACSEHNFKFSVLHTKHIVNYSVQAMQPAEQRWNTSASHLCSSSYSLSHASCSMHYELCQNTCRSNAEFRFIAQPLEILYSRTYSRTYVRCRKSTPAAVAQSLHEEFCAISCKTANVRRDT